MGSDLVRFSIAMPEDLLCEFDRYVAKRGISVNRSEAIRDLARAGLARTQVDAGTAGSCMAARAPLVTGETSCIPPGGSRRKTP